MALLWVNCMQCVLLHNVGDSKFSSDLLRPLLPAAVSQLSHQPAHNCRFNSFLNSNSNGNFNFSVQFYL